MASPRTLSLAAIPSRPVKGRRSASSYPFGPGSSPGCPRTAPEFLEKDASLRLLQPTSLHEHPADCSIPGCVSLRVTPRGVLTPRCARARTRRLALGHGPGGDEVGSPTPLARRANQVELRLTANLQLQPLSQLVTGSFKIGLSARSFSIRYTRPSAVLAGLRSTAPLRRASRSGRFQPRTEHATKPLTSSSAIQGGPGSTVDREHEGSPSRSRAEPDPRHPGPLDPPRPPPRQRTTTESNQDAFHRREPPREEPAGHDGFRHRDAASALLHPRSLPGGRAAG